MRNDPRSHGLWEMTAPAAPVTAALSGAEEAEVVIIGAGYTGLSTALHLAERGRSVVLLEAVESGFGGAGRNVGLVNAGMWVMPEALCSELGEDYGTRLIRFLGDGPRQVWEVIDRYGISCEGERQGTLHLGCGANGLKELKERARQWQKYGAPVHILDERETAAKLATGAYSGSLLDLRAGTIQPLAYARGLAHAAVAKGVKLFTGTPATSIGRNGADWVVTTPGGTVTAKWVVPATDAYTTLICPEILSQQVILPYFNIATQPLSKDLQARILPERQGCWDTKEVLSSFRFDQKGRLVFGSVGALRGTGLPIHRDWTRRSLQTLWPEMQDIRFEAEWYGRIGMTANNLPRFHKLNERMVTTCGYNGRGIAPGTVFGKLLAAYICGEVKDADLPLEPSTPKAMSVTPLREAYYELGAQVAHFFTARF